MDLEDKTIEDLENIIVQNIEDAKVKGYTLVTKSWGNAGKKCACALGCVLVNSSIHKLSNISDVNIKNVSELLDVSQSWVISFYRGYDDQISGNFLFINKKAYDLGCKLRERFNPPRFIDGQIIKD